MKNIIFSNINKPITTINRRSIFKRHRNQISNNDHTKAHFTPIIELKPILNGSNSNNDESIRKITKIISTNTIQKDSQRINTIVIINFISKRIFNILKFYFLDNTRDKSSCNSFINFKFNSISNTNITINT